MTSGLMFQWIQWSCMIQRNVYVDSIGSSVVYGVFFDGVFGSSVVYVDSI